MSCLLPAITEKKTMHRWEEATAVECLLMQQQPEPSSSAMRCKAV